MLLMLLSSSSLRGRSLVCKFRVKVPAPIQAANTAYAKNALELLKKCAEHTSIEKMFSAYAAAEFTRNWLLLKKKQQLKVKE